MGTVDGRGEGRFVGDLVLDTSCIGLDDGISVGFGVII